ncbi:AAEL005912-PA [Aedes aegypti]|uniref:AAEL005912-PA n=1 Tax=Aedes aegypti TaxID=7159 RepID=Q0IFC1_AEDAE|nr:AAEL005912-PA [Aedes aegypti]
MCSGTTFKFLCYFYACCNIFCAISIAVGADKVSEKITRDNCSSGTSSEISSLGNNAAQEICNKKTYAALVFMLALGCFMSLLMVVGVAMGTLACKSGSRQVLMKLYYENHLILQLT